MTDRTRAAVLAAAGSGFLVGAAMVASRSAVQELGPATLAFLRYVVGVACLAPFVIRRPVRFARRDILPIAALGVGQFGLLILLLNFGLLYLTAARASLLFSTMPLITMVLAAAVGRESLTWPKAAGVGIAIMGVAIALADRLGEDGTGAAPWLGAIAAIGAAISGAVCSIFYRSYVSRYPTVPVGALAMLAASVSLAGPALLEGGPARLLETSSAGWFAVAFVGLASAVGYVLWLWALANTTPTRVTVFVSLSPVTAALLGSVILGEALTLAPMIGLAAVTCGLLLATVPREKGQRVA